jgi:hypothetical protein
MSTQEVKDYFKSFGEVQVVWINDSSCTIQFSTPQLAEKAYNACALSSNRDGVKVNLKGNTTND